MNEPNISRRQKIIEYLKEEPISFMSIANKLALSMKELEEDFTHISESFNLKTKKAQCKKCEYEFNSDRRFKTPSKCPSCRGERIESQKVWI